jgi:hypothetical protein
MESFFNGSQISINRFEFLQDYLFRNQTTKKPMNQAMINIIQLPKEPFIDIWISRKKFALQKDSYESLIMGGLYFEVETVSVVQSQQRPTSLP